jgi:hypothetical protein
MIKKFSDVSAKESKTTIISKPSENKSDEQVKKVEDKSNNKVEFFGKVAKFPKNVDPKKASAFLENIKVKKTKLWYIMVEKQNTEDGTDLQMLKYNMNQGVDLGKFVADLAVVYGQKYPHLMEAFKGMKVVGNSDYTAIQNIPTIDVDGKKLITILTTDLVKLLSV